jgi:hypothetical protein
VSLYDLDGIRHSSPSTVSSADPRSHGQPRIIWTGQPYTVQSRSVRLTACAWARAGGSRMGPHGASTRPGVARAGVASPGRRGQPIAMWSMTRRCVNGPFAPERKAMRSGPRRGSSRWRKIPWASGSIAPPSRVGLASCRYGHRCPSERVRWTHEGALSIRKTRLSRGRHPRMPPMARPGLGWRGPRRGAWSWPVSSASAHPRQPMDGWSGSRLSRRTGSPV